MVDKYFVAYDLSERPNVIGSSRGRNWSPTVPSNNAITIEALAKTTMGTGQIEVSLIQMHLSFQPQDLLGEGHGLSSKTAVFMSHVQVMAFDMHRLDIMEGNIPEHGFSESPHHL